jgi:glycosyltransferase involved in cell wall biosynthesis
VRILIFHGYLLSGTGSNVYNARLAEALAGLGHEVHLLSQERRAQELPFVDALGDWDAGALRVRSLREPVRCTVYRPDIGGLLPVYVADRYEGIEARTFAECSGEEIARYIALNVAAVRELRERVRPRAALANHLVMGPVILARGLGGEVPYAVKVHGSALEYTVKPQPQRFLGFAREGVAGARTILVGSRHTAASLWEALADPELPKRTRLGPPGVDIAEFSPRERAPAAAGVRTLASRLRAHAAPPDAPTDAFARDERAAAAALERLDPENDRLVAFVGKLIVSKGIDLLIAAWPLVLEQLPQARLVVVGFGAYRSGAEELIGALATGDLPRAREIALAGRALEEGTPVGSGPEEDSPAGTGLEEGSPPGRGLDGRSPAGGQERGTRAGAPLRHLLAFLDGLPPAALDRYLLAARALGERVVLTGRLEHSELADLLPACEALVVPSTFPEAFGMVAVEAAASGAFPISADHSGLAEVSEALARAVPREVAGWLSFPVDDEVVGAIATRVLGWLTADPGLRVRARAGLLAVVRERWSWEGVARGVIAAARGELDALEEP